jgi:multidrug efflux pump subunit AcrB
MDNNSQKDGKKGLKEFFLTTIAVDNRTSIFLLTFMVVLFGILSYQRIPKESFPEIPMPEVFVNTFYFGNSASDIENLITRPIEKELQKISEIKKISSQSVQDVSMIVAEFDADVDIDDAVRKLKDAVDIAKQELPTDLTEEPEVLEINLSDLPVMTVNLSGEFSNDELKNYAEYLEDQIEELSEISDVDIKGALDREIEINVDIIKMQSLQLSFTDIENAINSENVTMSGGEILKNDFRRTIRIVGEFENAKEIENVIIQSENQKPIYLRDFATVEFTYQDKTSIARADLLPVISLDVIKRRGENLLDASDKIKLLVEEAKENVFPEDLKVNIFNDQSVQTRDMVSNLENSIISGVILVVLVLLFFLGLRNASFVGLAIPLSMLMGIMIISLIGYTMNMVVLFSLILALGMLVDNAIVVVENIYRYMQEGYSGIEAAKFATGEVALPIIASTATTLAAFMPLAFWPGLMGSFMKYLPITLIIVLSSSLFVALVINPVITSKFMKVDEIILDKKLQTRKRKNLLIGSFVILVLGVLSHIGGIMWLGNILLLTFILTLINYFLLRPASFFFQDKVIPFLEKVYDRFIRFSLHKKNPIMVFGGTILLLFFSFFLIAIKAPKVEFFPTADPLFVNAFIELPMGKDIEATNSIMSEIETRVDVALKPYDSIVEAVLAQIGENTSDPAGPPQFGSSPHKGRLTVQFVPSVDRNDISTWDAMEDIREAVTDIPGVQIIIDKNQDGPPQEKPVNIEFTGEDVEVLAAISEQAIAHLKSKDIAGIEELIADVRLGKPELLVDINRDAARKYGASTFAIADVIRTSVFGKEISKYKLGEDEYPINIRVNEDSRYNVSEILNQKVTFRSQSDGKIHQVPISAVAEVSYSSTFNSINRKDQKRSIIVYSNTLPDFNANEVVAEVKEAMSDFEIPRGYKYEFTGQQQQQAEETQFLISALIIAVFTIFIIIVSQFNSLVSPFIIILSVVFSLIGVLLGYVFTGMDINVIMTGIGIISLAGIVVNNAIVLVDYVNLVIKRKRLERGFSSIYQLSKDEIKESIIKGGATRLRPVLLTAITTVLGLIPLAIGFNFNFFTFISELDPQFFMGGDNVAFWGTMAWTVIFGLVFATFLTLVVVPVMYWLFFRLNIKLTKLFGQS